MTGVVKADYSPKKGKENKNFSNHIPVPTVKKNAKNEAKTPPTPKKERVDEPSRIPVEKGPNEKKINKSDALQGDKKDVEEINNSSTSNRSIRPQTKVLRRPTPNLKHPVIPVDSDDSGGDSSSSDKSKDDNPKRLKMGGENPDASSHKQKNFIMYNKYNVDKNIKNAPKERTSATLSSSIPNPCNSCNRSQAPERLHSHVRKDARGLMHRRSPTDGKVAPASDAKTPSPVMDAKTTSNTKVSSTETLDIKMASPTFKSKVSSPVIVDVKMLSPTLDVKMASPQKKPLNKIGQSKRKIQDSKRSSSVERVNVPLNPIPTDAATGVESEEQDSLSDICVDFKETLTPLKEPIKACYICRNEFKASVLLLHESKCLENWKKTNNALTPNLRQLPPRRPQEDPLDDAKDPAWLSVQSQLVPCPLCSRTFFPERLPVHRRVCKGKQSPSPLKRASSLREKSASSTDGEDSKTPLYLACYVCHRNYGSWVLAMHEQQCLKKWRKENNKLFVDDQQEEPTKNPECDEDVASLIELGDRAWESHLQQLVPCPRCSRTFFPDRLEIHERSCKGSTSNRRPHSNKGI